MTETKHGAVSVSPVCFFLQPRAAARPAAIPVAQAHCRLKPPQSPAASSTSPERYRPGHLREAQPSVFTSASGTPPPVTCACVQGSVPSTAKRQFLSALARAFTSLRERLPGARESGCRPQLFSIACPSFLATSPSRSVSSEANMPDAQRCSSIPRRTGNAISGKIHACPPPSSRPGQAGTKAAWPGFRRGRILRTVLLPFRFRRTGHPGTAKAHSWPALLSIRRETLRTAAEQGMDTAPPHCGPACAPKQKRNHPCRTAARPDRPQPKPHARPKRPGRPRTHRKPPGPFSTSATSQLHATSTPARSSAARSTSSTMDA